MIGQTVYVAFIEDEEGCGYLTLSVHATRATAEAFFIQTAVEDFQLSEDCDITGMTADEVSDYLEENYGKNGGVREEKVMP